MSTIMPVDSRSDGTAASKSTSYLIAPTPGITSSVFRPRILPPWECPDWEGTPVVFPLSTSTYREAISTAEYEPYSSRSPPRIRAMMIFSKSTRLHAASYRARPSAKRMLRTIEPPTPILPPQQLRCLATPQMPFPDPTPFVASRPLGRPWHGQSGYLCLIVSSIVIIIFYNYLTFYNMIYTVRLLLEKTIREGFSGWHTATATHAGSQLTAPARACAGAPRVRASRAGGDPSARGSADHARVR